jgi:hypothetical protein
MSVIKIVMGDWFMDSPRMSKEMAIETVNKALACTEFEQADKPLHELIYDEHCPGWRDEFEQTEAQQLVSNWPNCAKSDWIATHDALVDRLSKAATEEIGTPYDVLVERDLACREIGMTMRCRSCGYEQHGGWPERYTVEMGWADKAFALLMDAWQADNEPEGQGCDCLDGLTPGLILDTWTCYLHARDAVPVVPVLEVLTQRQLETARSLWSASLRAKQQEAREKERVEVVCERDEEGE